MASVAFLNAAVDSLRKDLHGLVRLLPDIPFVDEESVALKHIDSPEGTAMMLKAIKNLMAAGEAADARIAKES